MFKRTWSITLNDWVYTDVVAVEMEDPKSTPLKFPPGGPIGPHGLSETAALFKKSCFFNTPQKTRLKALEQCWSSQQSIDDETDNFKAKNVGNPSQKDQELSELLATIRRPTRKFF